MSIGRGARLAVLGAAGMATLWALSALAANQVVNFHFNTNVDGWVTSQSVSPGAHAATFVWDAADPFNDPASGSVRVTNIQEQQFTTNAAIITCISVTAGDPFQAAARAFIPAGQARTGSAMVAVMWFSQPGCPHASGIVTSFGTEVTALDAWTVTSVSSTVPSDAKSVRVELNVRKTVGAAAGLAALFDDVYYGPPGGFGMAPRAVTPLLARD